MESVELIGLYSTLHTVSLYVFIAGLLLSIIIAIVYNIPLVFMQITGIEQRRFSGKVKGNYEKLSNKGMMSDSHSGARKVKIEAAPEAPKAPQATAARAAVPPTSAETTIISQVSEKKPEAGTDRASEARGSANDDSSVPTSSRATTMLSSAKREEHIEAPANTPDEEVSDFLIVQRIYCVNTEEKI